MTQTALARINALDRTGFALMLGAIYEHSPWAAERAFEFGPFADARSLTAALRQSVDSASAAEQLALIRAHPELAGDKLRAKGLTAQSLSEQKGAGLDRLTEDEIGLWTRLNAIYRGTFGFPFIICVRLHTRGEILAALQRRLAASREEELAEAIAQIHDIARLRLVDIIDRLGEVA